MKRTSAAGDILIGLVIIAIGIALPWNSTDAATQSVGFKWERETGRQKIQPAGVVAQLTIPPGTTNAEFYIESGAAFVRWDGGVPADAATGAMKWPEGHFRKEENDAAKLNGFRVLCASCTVWVGYSRERRIGDAVP